MNKVLVTHNDFDGVTCAILFKSVWPDGTVFFEDYRTVNDRLRHVLEHYQKADLYIADIHPENDEKLIAMLDEKYPNVLLLDHHKTARHLSIYPWALVETGVCGAVKFYEYLKMCGLPHEKYLKLVFHANDYDMWIHNNPLSAALNKLLYIYGRDRFVERFLKNPNPELTDFETSLIELENERQDRYIQETTKELHINTDSLGRRYILTFAEQYSSQLCHHLLKKFPADYVITLDFHAKKASIRSRTGGVDVSTIAKSFGGGGHANSAGFVINDDMMCKIRAEIAQRL